MKRASRLLAVLVLTSCLAAGCSAPAATLDLITVARKALADAQSAQQAQHAEIVRSLEAHCAALDDAFDRDVRLVAAGQIEDASGNAIALSPEWVISARKGYTAAYSLLRDEVQGAKTAHAQRLDNLKAADESLDMASQLIVRQMYVGERIRQGLLSVQRALIKRR